MWSVIETIEEGKRLVIAVPTAWISEENLLWPPKNVSSSSARKKCMQPDEAWSKSSCINRILAENIGKLFVFFIV